MESGRFERSNSFRALKLSLSLQDRRRRKGGRQLALRGSLGAEDTGPEIVRGGNSRKSPAEFNKTPVFRRLGLGIEE
jgi:hypothetical protein